MLKLSPSQSRALLERGAGGWASLVAWSFTAGLWRAEKQKAVRLRLATYAGLDDRRTRAQVKAGPPASFVATSKAVGIVRLPHVTSVQILTSSLRLTRPTRQRHLRPVPPHLRAFLTPQLHLTHSRLPSELRRNSPQDLRTCPNRPDTASGAISVRQPRTAVPRADRVPRVARETTCPLLGRGLKLASLSSQTRVQSTFPPSPPPPRRIASHPRAGTLQPRPLVPSALVPATPILPTCFPAL
ncbi:hypothetical protein BDY21DRAFT_357642 [Lineolata rhizophorae]|uniref:Uncharacterized protein n=1 Tax=Lineolata rhizophorae TaxID=578093 RepID=A0A6A6NML8_9PEZI|nr:hypothetical protein BDY21DRAFT_357642 [Lineolata rhizophorae]